MIYRFSFTIAVAIALNFACKANGLVNVPGFDKFNAIGQNNSHIRERADYGNGTSNRDMGIRLPLLIAEDQKDFLENEPSRKNIALKGTQVTVDNIIYDVSGDTAIVYNGKSCSGAVTIPESITYNGKSYRTTTIGAGAFFSCIYLSSVTIPNSVTTIGKNAFAHCRGMASVSFSNSVTTIDKGAFYFCSNLTSVTIPNSVTTIGESAFAACSGLTSVSIPNSVTNLEKSSFSSCM